MVLSLNIEIFVLYIIYLKAKILMDSLSEIIILIKYLDYADIFETKFMAKLSEYNNNNHTIKLKKNK